MNGRTARRLAATLLLLGAVGCSGGRYPVSGRVTFPDGSPLTEGTVIGESGDGAERVMAQGDLRPDGTFEWGTIQPRDGARPGVYRVAVLPHGVGDADRSKGVKPAVAKKFTDPNTSGITFEVKETRNELNITVTKPGTKEP